MSSALLVGCRLGLLTARWNVFHDTIGTLGARIANVAKRLLGAARAALVRSNRSRHAVCRGHGNALVGGHRDRYRRAQRPADLSPRRADHGLKTFAYLVQGDPAGGAAVYR